MALDDYTDLPEGNIPDSKQQKPNQSKEEVNQELDGLFDNIEKYSDIERNKMSDLLKKNRKELGFCFERSSGDSLIRKTLAMNKENIINQLAEENKNILKNSDIITKKILIEKLKKFDPFIKKEFEKYANRIGINYIKYLELDDSNLNKIPESFWIAIIQGLMMQHGYEKNLGYYKNPQKSIYNADIGESISIDGSFGPNTLYTTNEIYDHINKGDQKFSGLLNEGSGQETILEFLLGEKNNTSHIDNDPNTTDDHKKIKEVHKFHPIDGEPNIIGSGFAKRDFNDLLKKYGSKSIKSKILGLQKDSGYMNIDVNKDGVKKILIKADQEKKELHFKLILDEGKHGSEQIGSIKCDDSEAFYKFSIYTKKIKWIDNKQREYTIVSQSGEEGNYKNLSGREAGTIISKIKGYTTT